MTVRHRRRIHAETVAPWAALSFVLFIWWGAAKALDWVRPGHRFPMMSFGRHEPAPPAIPKRAPVDTAPAESTLKSSTSGPTISPNTTISGSDIASLRSRSLLIPVKGFEADKLVSSFYDARGRRRHEAIDILAPRGTDVLAVDEGRVAKIFTSDAGGLTVYQFDPSETFVYYYAHLDEYAPNLKEGVMLRKGDVVGKVGTTGNAPRDTPHLHFAISKLDPDRRWWGGTALDPFLIWRDPSEN